MLKNTHIAFLKDLRVNVNGLRPREKGFKGLKEKDFKGKNGITRDRLSLVMPFQKKKGCANHNTGLHVKKIPKIGVFGFNVVILPHRR